MTKKKLLEDIRFKIQGAVGSVSCVGFKIRYLRHQGCLFLDTLFGLVVGVVLFLPLPDCRSLREALTLNFGIASVKDLYDLHSGTAKTIACEDEGICTEFEFYYL